MKKKKENKTKKEYVETYVAGNFYSFQIYRIEDAAHRVFYTAHPVNHGGTRNADTLEEVKRLVDAEVPIINDFLAKTR